MSYALKRFKDDVECIAAWKNFLAENVIRSCEDRSTVPRPRLECWRVISRSAVYLNERLLGYESPIWRAIRGDTGAQDAVLALERMNYCCAPSALDMRAILYLSRSDGKDRIIPRGSLIITIVELRKRHLRKGGNATKDTGYRFSALRNLGVRMPRRACSLFVLDRELALHQCWMNHNLRVEKRTNDLFW